MVLVPNYPEVKLRAIVRDSSGNFIKNLAPPFEHHEDWLTIWTPLIQKHPKWGEKEIKKIKVFETQFERIDTTSLVKLQQEERHSNFNFSNLKAQPGFRKP